MNGKTYKLKVPNKLLVFFFAVIITIVYMGRVDYKFRYRKAFSEYLFTPEKHIKSKNMKYVLQWTSDERQPFQYMLKGQETFKKRRCTVQNCFITHNQSYFNNLTQFDVILFHGKEISRYQWSLPQVRLPYQKYVFVSKESSDYYPICSPEYQTFFNWTWTYRLDSDLSYAYIAIRNSKGELIGPKQEMHWIKLESMNSINDSVKAKLQNKTKAAAWFVSNCHSLSKREKFVTELQEKLKIYGLEVDVYGWCGKKKCPRERENECFEKIQKDYYFYLAFENSFSDDYVTEKVLHALQHYAVPIVYGAANYTRFMPDGIYLDARKLGAEELAKQMNEIIHDKERYFNYFKWHNHYSFHKRSHAPDSDPYCRFCAILNNEEALEKHTVYDDFSEWWNPSKKCKNVNLQELWISRYVNKYF